MKAVDPNGKGPRWERVVADYGYAAKFPWDRAALHGNRDLGDIIGCWDDGWIIGCKSLSAETLQARLSEGMDKIRDAKANFARKYPGRHDHMIGVQVVQRRNHRTGRAYVVMEYDDFLRLAEMRRDWDGGEGK